MVGDKAEESGTFLFFKTPPKFLRRSIALALFYKPRLDIDHRRSIQNVCRNHLGIYDTPRSLCGMYFLSKQPDDRLILDKYQSLVILARQVINNPRIRPSSAPGEDIDRI